MASFGMGFVHAMLIDISDGSDRGSTWDRERRLADSLVDATSRFGASFEPPADDAATPPPPPARPPGGLGAAISSALALLHRALPAR